MCYLRHWRSQRQVVMLLLLSFFFFTEVISQECAPYPIASKLGNVTLSNGRPARGIAFSVGTPPQEFAFMPQWPVDNVIVYGTNGYCTPPAPPTDDGCTTWRGGQYDPVASETRRIASADTYPKNPGGYPDMDYMSDKFKLNDNVTLSELPIGIPLQDWRQEGYRPMMSVGLGSNSTVLNALKSGGKILSRTWSMFNGWTGANPRTQLDGIFVFGGYDRAKVTGRGYQMSMTDHSECDSRLMVTISDMILNFPNGTTASLFPKESNSFSACITPDYPILMTMPLAPYFNRFQFITDANIMTRTGGMAYFTMLYRDEEEAYKGDLTIKLQSGPSIRIPNHQLVVPDRHIDEETSEWTANGTSRNIIINPVQEINQHDLAMLGRQFLTAAYIMVNQDAGEFTIWASNPTNAIDLVAVDESGNEITEWCDDSKESSSASSTSASATASAPANSASPSPSDAPEEAEGPSIGLIAGVAVGGAVALIIIGVVAFLLVRRRRRRRVDEAAAQPPTEDMRLENEYFHHSAQYNPSLGVFELPQRHFSKNGYYKPELQGTFPTPSPSPSHVQKETQQRHYELAG